MFSKFSIAFVLVLTFVVFIFTIIVPDTGSIQTNLIVNGVFEKPITITYLLGKVANRNRYMTWQFTAKKKGGYFLYDIPVGKYKVYLKDKYQDVNGLYCINGHYPKLNGNALIIDVKNNRTNILPPIIFCTKIKPLFKTNQNIKKGIVLKWSKVPGAKYRLFFEKDVLYSKDMGLDHSIAAFYVKTLSTNSFTIKQNELNLSVIKKGMLTPGYYGVQIIAYKDKIELTNIVGFYISTSNIKVDE